VRDDEDESAPPVPRGAKNYISPAGHARLRGELDALLRVERPKVVEIVAWAAGNGDRSENGDYLYGKKRLREIDRRVRFLSKRLEIAEVVDPAQQPQRDRVFFGATVTYVDENDAERTVTILGADEADIARGEVSLYSPIARALLRARVGDTVKLHTPSGVTEIEVVAISYPDKQYGVTRSTGRGGA
jgi:transcription elongation factor GreB